MIEELFVILAIGGGIIASVTDVRSGIIPNRMTFPLILIGIFGYLAHGLAMGNLSTFFALLKGIVVIFIVGYLMWVLRAWSAGDAKEFLFIAALIPVYPAFLYGTLSPTIASYPFVVTVFINTFLSIFPFIFIYSIYVSLKKGLASQFFSPLKSIQGYIKTAFLLVAALAISKFFGIWLLTPFAILLLYRVPYGSVASALVISAHIFTTGPSVYSQFQSTFSYFFISLLIIVAIGLFKNSISIIRNKALIEEIKITDLSEGEIVAEEIYIRDDEVLRDKRSMVEKIKDAARDGAYQNLFQGKSVVGTGAAGVTGEEVKLLQGYVKDGKLKDRINVKKSMPFAPVIFAGLLLSLTIGDAMLALKTWLYG